MEFLTILLSSLLGLIAPTGLAVDRTAENAIRSQLNKVDRLEVRVDNAPSYNLLQGKVERVRIAGRGLKLKQQDIRIAEVELETDPIDLDPRSLGKKQPKLRRALSAGVRLVLEDRDINQALKSPAVEEILRDLDIPEIGSQNEDSQTSYKFVNPRVELLPNERLRLQVELTADNQPSLEIVAESGLGVVAGRQIQLVKPIAYVNREEVTQQIVRAIATSLNKKLDLGNFDMYGLNARILQLKLNPQKLEIVAFLQVEPSSRFWQHHQSPK